jgi:hypothetical protein
MRIFTLLILLGLGMSNLQAQSLRKVSGKKYLGASYGLQKDGFNVTVGFDNYFKKNLAYSAQLSYESVNAENFSNTDIYISGGLKYFFSLPVDNLYLGAGSGVYFGKQYAIHNILNDNSDDWIWGLYFAPTVEYYIVSTLSLQLSYKQFFDFNNDFRNYHYSFNVGLFYSF